MTITAELLPSTPPATGRDRRRFTRVRVSSAVPVVIGRGTGTLIDLSANGARIRHASPVALGARVRVTFDWSGERFEATAEVLASRVAALAGTTQFESRMRFVSIAAESQEVLARVLTDLLDHDLRKWVANLHGWNEPSTQSAPPPAPLGFIRCRYAGGRWQLTPTRDPHPPLDGFTVVADTAPAEIRALCRTWEASDDSGRRLLAQIADVVAKGAQDGMP